MIWTIIFTVLISYIVSSLYTFWKNINHFREHGTPYTRPWWIVGNMWKVITRQVHLSKTLLNFYKISPRAKYVGFFDFSCPVIMLRDLELIKITGIKHSENFPDHRGFVDEKLDPFFATNLFSLKGQKWHNVRTLLNPAFTSSKMKTMFQVMTKCAADFADFLLEQSSKGNDIVEMKDVFTRYTNDIIAACAFGIKIDSLRDRNNDFYVLGRKATNFDGILSLKFLLLRSFPMITKFFQIRLIDEKIYSFFTNVIRNTVSTREAQKIIKQDMLQLMIDAKGKANELSIDEMTAQAFIFFFGGFETTSTLMCFAAHEIAANPDIHKKLQAEVDDVWQKSSRKLNYEVLNEMRYMDAVINETIRKYPPALMVDRVCAKEFELPANFAGQKPYICKPGTIILYPIHALHHDPKYFPDPDKFDPERFYQKQVTSNNPAYLPFGLGPRMCIGNRFALQETKIVLFQLLVRFNFKVSPKTCVPMEISMSSFVFLAKGGFWLKLEPRKNRPLELSTDVLRNGSVSS